MARAWCSRPAVQGGACGFDVEGDDVGAVDLAARSHTGERGLKGGPPGGHPTVTALHGR